LRICVACTEEIVIHQRITVLFRRLAMAMRR
jgi:hypothetical protein